MWTTLGVSWLNFESGMRKYQSRSGDRYEEKHSQIWRQKRDAVALTEHRSKENLCILPLKGALSSSSFPNEMSLIELGLDGLTSHSVFSY
jgi:hypothetical protein